MERSPWTFNTILAVAAKIRSGNGPLTSAFYKCLEEAQAIARASLFGPVVRKEAVQGSFPSHWKPLLIDPSPQVCFCSLPGAPMAGYLVDMLCVWRWILDCTALWKN